jgi:predicted porin
MKKLAFAAAALAAAPWVHAQSSVSIVGLVDEYVGSMRYAGDPGRTKLLGSGGMTTSFFGFTGAEDLGGGTKAYFALTSFFRADTGSMGRFDGDPFFARDANVGISGTYGSLQLGRAAAPNFIPTVLVNPFGNSFAFSPLVLHANVNTTRWLYRTTPSDTGWSNQVVYSTPTIAGLRLNLHYQFGEQSSSAPNKGKNNAGVSAIYVNGPLTVAGFYERDQISNPVNPGVITATVNGVTMPTTRKDWMLGGAYDFGVLKAYASYGKSKTEVTHYQGATTSLGVSVPVGSTAGQVLAAVAKTKVTGSYDGARTTASLAYDYYLSKRTDVYAALMHDRATAMTNGTSLGVGIRHRF